MMPTGYIKSYFGMDTTPAQEGLRKLTGVLSSTAGKLVAFGAVVSILGLRYMNKAGKEVVAFQREVAELSKLLGETDAFPISEAIADLSTKMPIAREELSEVAATAARLGIRGTANLLKFTETMAMMGVATDVSATDAADALARIAKQTQLPIKDIDRLASSINELSNTTATSAGEIIENMRRMAPEYARMGFSVDEIAALSATMNIVSESATRAGTRLRRLMQEMTSPEKVQLFAAAIGETEINFGKLRKQDPSGTLVRVIQAMKEGGVEALRLANSLDARARLAVIALSQAEADLIINLETSAKAFSENISIQKEYSRFLEIMPSKMQVYQNEMRELRREVGEAWLPVMKKWLEFKRDFGRGLSMVLTKPYFYDLMTPEDAKKLEEGIRGIGDALAYARSQKVSKMTDEEIRANLGDILVGQTGWLDKEKLEEYFSMQLNTLNDFSNNYLDILTLFVSRQNQELVEGFDEAGLKSTWNIITSILQSAEDQLAGNTDAILKLKVSFASYIQGLRESGRLISGDELVQGLMMITTNAINASGAVQEVLNKMRVPPGYEEVSTRLFDLLGTANEDVAELQFRLKNMDWDKAWFGDQGITDARARWQELKDMVEAGQELTEGQKEELRFLDSIIPAIAKEIALRSQLRKQLEDQTEEQRKLNAAQEEAKGLVRTYEGEMEKMLSAIDELERGPAGARDAQIRMWRSMLAGSTNADRLVENLTEVYDILQGMKEGQEIFKDMQSEEQKLFEDWQRRMDNLNLASLQSKFRLMERVLDGIADGFLDMTEAIITGSGNAEEAIVDMIYSITRELIRSQIFRLLGSLPGFQGLFGISRPSGFSVVAEGPSTFHTGGYEGYSNPLGGVNFQMAGGGRTAGAAAAQETVVVNNNFSIQALDSASVREMLVRERDTIAGITVTSIDRNTSLKRRMT